jgi:hypothetical protein
MTQPPQKVYPILQTTQAPDLTPAVGSVDPHVKMAEIYMAEHAATAPPEPRKQKNLTQV